MRNLFIYIITAVTLTSCLSGGFDENPQLEELEEGLKAAPKVETLKVNGSEVVRDMESRRIIEAKVNDVLNFDITLSAGTGELQELEFSRVYYYGEDFEEDPKPVDPATDGTYDITGANHTFTYAYTVPEEDDDGFHFDPGYVIQVYVRAKNSLGNYGYRAVEIHIVE
jgi:hypothetical protein